jgi:hypothetical protein
MPELLHLNGLDKKINKRIVNAMLRQVQSLQPDVPPPPVDSDVNQNYLALMKSLSFIILILSEIQAKRFAGEPLGEEDYFDLPEISDITGSEFSALQSQASQGSQGSYAPFGSQASSVSAPFVRPGMRSPASSVYSGSQVSSSIGQPSSRYEQERLSQYSEPRRQEQSLASIERMNEYSKLGIIDIGGLNKEIINAEFLAEVIPFAQLTKIQKEKLKQKLVLLNNKKGLINISLGKPIYNRIKKLIKNIQLQLQGEGSASEFMLRTEEEMPPDIDDPIGGVVGAGRKRRLLSPAMYNAHNFNPYNVNANFSYNQAKRNI